MSIIYVVDIVVILMHKAYIFAILLSILLIPLVSAQSTSHTLSKYNITGVTSIDNITHLGMNYSLVWINQNHLLINNTGNYSFITNSSEIAGIVSPYLTNKYYPNPSVFSNISNSIKHFRAPVDRSLKLCLSFTGLMFVSCTYQNNCRSCSDSNYCEQTLANYGPAFKYGIMNFSQTYSTFNGNYTEALNLAKNINKSNYGQYINKMYASALNISASSAAMPHSDIFPVKNVSRAQLKKCPYRLVSTPWYCGSRYIGGFCPAINFNASKISNIVTQIRELRNLPVYNQTIMNFSVSSVYVAYSYLNHYNNTVNLKLFNDMINSTNPIYNATVENATFITGKIGDPELLSALSILKSNFTRIKLLKNMQNITSANLTMNRLIANAVKLYNNASNLYLPLYNTTQNNTFSLKLITLNYPQDSIPSYILSLQNQQKTIAGQLANQITYVQLPALYTNSIAISKSIHNIPPPSSTAEFVKKTDYWFVNPLLTNSNTPIGSRNSAAAYLAMLLSIIIGVIVSIIIYLAYSLMHNGKKKHKRKPKKKGKGTKAVRNYKNILIGILILFIISYSLITLHFAQQANSFIPTNYFIQHMKSSNTIALYTNSTLYTACTNSIKSKLGKSNKTLLSVTNPIAATIIPKTFSKDINSTGTTYFNVSNNTKSMSIEYSASNSSGTILIKNPSSKLMSEFILNGGMNESGKQTIPSSNGIQKGKWSISYTLTSNANISINRTFISRNTDNSILTLNKVVSSSIPTFILSNRTAYKGLLGYTMYINSSMLKGNKCTVLQMIK